MEKATGTDLRVDLGHAVFPSASLASTSKNSLSFPPVLMEQSVVFEQAATCALQLGFKGDRLIRLVFKHNH